MVPTTCTWSGRGGIWTAGRFLRALRELSSISRCQACRRSEGAPDLLRPPVTSKIESGDDRGPEVRVPAPRTSLS